MSVAVRGTYVCFCVCGLVLQRRTTGGQLERARSRSRSRSRRTCEPSPGVHRRSDGEGAEKVSGPPLAVECGRGFGSTASGTARAHSTSSADRLSRRCRYASAVTYLLKPERSETVHGP
jgi:hypothetical protein